MPQLKPELETIARIKVVGAGGSGNHAVTRMMEEKIRGVEFVAVNCDAQDLHQSKAHTKVHIGKNVTRGLGAGMNPDLGRQAGEENRSEVAEALRGADMVFLAGGLGGGTFTGSAPTIAEVARELGALTVAVVTKPFGFEGLARARIAEEGWVRLRDRVDALITIPNDRLLGLVDKTTSLLAAFKLCDEVLKQGVQGISDLITMPGLINVDFADVRTIMADAGSALMGVGVAGGEDRAVVAARSAISSPLLDVSTEGAKGVLFNVSGGPDMTMLEVHEAAKVITESVDKDAKLIFGAVYDERLKKGELKITVIATGFGTPNPRVTESKRPEGALRFAAVGPNSAAARENGEVEWEAVPAFLRRKR